MKYLFYARKYFPQSDNNVQSATMTEVFITVLKKSGDVTVGVVLYILQSVAKLFEHLRQNLRFSSGLFAHLLVMISTKPKDYDSTNIYFIKLH